MKNLLRNLILSAFALLGAQNVQAYLLYEYGVNNNTDFDLLTSLNFATGGTHIFCDNKDDVLIKAHKAEIYKEGLCTVTGLVAWVPQENKEPAVPAKQREAKWFGRFTGEGSFNIYWDDNNKKLFIVPPAPPVQAGPS